MVAPYAVRNEQFAATLGGDASSGLYAHPASAIKLMMGESAVLVLGGQHVLPKRLEESGFGFRWYDCRKRCRMSPADASLLRLTAAPRRACGKAAAGNAPLTAGYPACARRGTISSARSGSGISTTLSGTMLAGLCWIRVKPSPASTQAAPPADHSLQNEYPAGSRALQAASNRARAAGLRFSGRQSTPGRANQPVRARSARWMPASPAAPVRSRSSCTKSASSCGSVCTMAISIAPPLTGQFAVRNVTHAAGHQCPPGASRASRGQQARVYSRLHISNIQPPDVTLLQMLRILFSRS